MFIYFLEQVWCDQSNITEWSSLGWTTHETQRQFWDIWNFGGYKHNKTYPTAHMVKGEDYIDF